MGHFQGITILQLKHKCVSCHSTFGDTYYHSQPHHKLIVGHYRLVLHCRDSLGRNTRHETGDAGEVRPVVPVGCLRVGVVQHNHELGSTRGESRTSWLSSVLRIRSEALGSSSARHKCHNWFDIGRETILNSENRLFLYVFLLLSRLSGQSRVA
jgi:hypothetical protein